MESKTYPELSERDTKQRIVEASVYLFGLKGFDGTSTREIAKLAKVNISSLNYHFKSKQTLIQEVAAFVVDDFKEKIVNLAKDLNIKSSADYALLVYQELMRDGQKFLNEFKLILDTEEFIGKMDIHPCGFEQFEVYFQNDLNKSVPKEERLWAHDVIFNYLVHTAVLANSPVGKKHVERYYPKAYDSIPNYIRQLVDTIIRDLNQRYN